MGWRSSADKFPTELLSRDDTAMRLGVAVADVEQMICDGVLFAVGFATGVKVMLDEDQPARDTSSE